MEIWQKKRYEKAGLKAENTLTAVKERRNDIIEKQEITLKLYSPLTGDFYKNDVDEYGWNNGVADYPTLFSGVDMACYVDSIQKAVKQRSSDDGGNLMLYFDEERNPNVKAKTLSAIPSVESGVMSLRAAPRFV